MFFLLKVDKCATQIIMGKRKVSVSPSIILQFKLAIWHNLSPKFIYESHGHDHELVWVSPTICYVGAQLKLLPLDMHLAGMDGSLSEPIVKPWLKFISIEHDKPPT